MPFTNVISQNGPLPIVADMTVTAPNQLLLVAGSAYAKAGGPIVMEILVDALKVGECQIYANTAATHLAFVPAFIPLALAPGSSPFAVTLRAQDPAQTNTDNGDRFEVLLVE